MTSATELHLHRGAGIADRGLILRTTALVAAFLLSVSSFSPLGADVAAAAPGHVLSGRTTIVTTPRPVVNVHEPSITVKAPDTTEGEIISGAIGAGAAILGGFLAWAAGLNAEWFRQKFATRTAKTEAALALGGAVVAFANALGAEVNAADPQLQAKARLDTEAAAVNVLQASRRVGHRDLTTAATEVIARRDRVRELQTVTERGTYLATEFKDAITGFLQTLTGTIDEQKAA